MARKRGTSEMTDWGYYFTSLIKARRYDNLKQFTDDLESYDRGVTPQMVSKYRRGRAPLWFVADSIAVLELTEAETHEYIQKWLATWPEDERALLQRMCALMLQKSGRATDTEVLREPAQTPENERSLDAKRAEWDADDERRRRERGASGAGGGDGL